jgi:recombinational DNA repair protein RecR
MRERLSALTPTLTITSLGRGLSIGTELEYADPLSLNASLKKRE